MINALPTKKYSSYHGVNEIFSRITTAPAVQYSPILRASQLETRLGPMIAVADDHMLYLLEFLDWRWVERQIARLQRNTKSTIEAGRTPLINLLEEELNHYLDGKLRKFETPFSLQGSPFQKRVWEELIKIPYGETRSYEDIAKAIGKPSAFRAVAQANGANGFVIIVPCHRVINKNGNLGGYSSGLERKEWLLSHEKQT